ncbi:hypothetical protein [Actinomadura sp. DC4]|uniref:hypothetical protein n=1 Tax=Actinomadura sp. DC4 TaxID=3055069 RepID=UPI0025AF5329|nr:hypothetical protein [Actinomadura sp. DC4]MDN3355628.1 hypothetical protein [Actinomadura sp. DC4]
MLDDGEGVPQGPTTVREDVDAIDAKGIDPDVILGQLLGFILDVPWSVDLVDGVNVWPPQETAPASVEEFERLPEDSPWQTGPWLSELKASVRDALADVDESALPAIAERWTRIEEFSGHMDVVHARELIDDFVALARRARQAGDRLYCWCCL